MITFTVHESPDLAADRLDRAQNLAFVKDGFNIWAAVFTPFWLAVNRLWLVLAFYVAAATFIELAFWTLDVGQRPAAILLGALHLLIGFESDTLKRWTLARHGWSQIASVNGRNAEECERRFYESWLPGQPVIQKAALTGSSIVADGQPGLTRPLAARPGSLLGGWRKG